MENPQTQTSGQTQTPKLLEFEYRTWGRFGQYKEDIVILKDYTVIRPSKIEAPTRKGMKRVLVVNGIKIIIENHNSNKNRHTIVYIPEEFVHAVIKLTKTSGNFYISCTRGELVEVEEMREELSNDKRYKIIKVYRSMYFVEGDKEVLVNSELVDVKKELIARPRIVIVKNSSKVQIEGDTYHVRHLLKELGFKWNSADKVWETKTLSDSVKSRLEQVAEVVEK